MIALRPRVSAVDVKEKIQESFRRNAAIDANRIEIDTLGNTVTLRGPVHSWMERDEATNAAYSIEGVTDVHNLTTIS